MKKLLASGQPEPSKAVHSEEDTFRALRKPHYDRMKEIWVESDLYKFHQRDTYYHVKLHKFFEEYGWTVEEYSNVNRILYGN